MTDITTALADTSNLPDYGNKPVIRTTISITRAGDGLSEGLSIDPQILPLGEVRYVVLECIVDSHEHDRLIDKGTDTGLLILNQVLKAGTGTLIDADVVKAAIAEQAEKIKAAKEAARIAQEKAKGIDRIPFDAAELEVKHSDGAHADGLVPGCPTCDAEVATQAEEAGAPPPEPTPISGRKPRAKK